MAGKYLRDDIWTFFSFTVLGVCLTQFVPVLTSPKLAALPQLRNSMFAFACAICFLRMLKIALLLCFGREASTKILLVETRARGSCIVEYAFKTPREVLFFGRRQMFHRNADLDVLYLPLFPSFHLVAWEDKWPA